MDQTPLPFFLVSNYTLARKGDKTVPIRNCSGYRQITGTFAVSMARGFLPIQLMYQGKTDCCHRNFAFPEKFHVTHTPWSNEKKTQRSRFLTSKKKRKNYDLKLRRNQEWLLTSDVFKAPWTDQMKDLSAIQQ